MTETLNSEIFSLASQLYVRMRRSSGRVVDAIYMAQNEQYAQEILKIAAQEKDQEVLMLVERFQSLLAKNGSKIATAIPNIPVLTETVKKLPKEQEKEKRKEPVAEKADTFSLTFRHLRLQTEATDTSTTPAVPHIDELEEEVAHHYTGALR